VYPWRKIQGHPRKDDYELFAVNGTTIAIYGTIPLSLNLCLQRDFKWRFIVADVPRPIIGMDFLSHYGLLVDPQNRRLIDRTTKISARVYSVDSEVDSVSIKTIIGETNYHRLLAEFPYLTRPPVFGRETTRHGVVHHINTTPEPLVSSKPRRLPPPPPTDSNW
jgi:hypothetical protein